MTKMPRLRLFSLLFVLAFVAGTQAILSFPEQNDTETVTFPCVRLTYFDPPAPSGYWDSQVLNGDWVYITLWDSPHNLTDRIVLYDGPSTGWSNEKTLSTLIPRNPKAMVIIYGSKSAYPGAGNWVRDGTKVTPHDFPVFEITQAQNASLAPYYLNDTIYNVTIEYEPNQWIPTFTFGLPIVGATIIIYSGIITIIAVWKLVLLLMTQGFKLNIAQIVLWFNIVGCLSRVLWCSADAFESYGTLPFSFSQVMLSFSFPFVSGGALLIALYWHEMIVNTGRQRISMFLTKMKWPFLGFCIFTFLFEVATSISRGLFYVLEWLIILNSVTYIAISLFVLIFFIVTRIRLQCVFDEINKRLNPTKRERLSVATFQVQAMSIMLGIWVFWFIFFGASTVAWTPIGYPVIWFLYYTNLESICLCEVLLIKAPIVTPYRVFRTLKFGDPLIQSTEGHGTTFVATMGTVGSREDRVGSRDDNDPESP